MWENSLKPVKYLELFFGRPLHTLNPRSSHHGWRRPDKFSKFLPSDALKMHCLSLSILRFPCKTFSKLPKFTLRNIWFLKNSYIQINDFQGIKLVRAMELKDAESSTEEITWNSVNYLLHLMNKSRFVNKS